MFSIIMWPPNMLAGAQCNVIFIGIMITISVEVLNLYT